VAIVSEPNLQRCSWLQKCLTPSATPGKRCETRYRPRRVLRTEPVCKAGLAQLADLSSQLGKENGSTQPGQEARDWCAHLTAKLESAATTADALLTGLRDLSERCARYLEEMDFDFLFDAHRQLFRIGYNVTAGKLDNNYYDLLASEARLASMVTIANNRSSKPLVAPGSSTDPGRRHLALLSWAGRCLST